MLRRATVTLDQLRVMASPVRARIIATVLATGDVSIAQIAAHIDRRPDSLYHHIRLMCQVGLLESAGYRVSGRNREAIYRAGADRFEIDRSNNQPDYIEAAQRLMRQHASEAVNQLTAAFDSDFPRDLLFFETINVRLNREQQENFRSDIAELMSRYKAESREESEHVTALMLLSPVVRP